MATAAIWKTLKHWSQRRSRTIYSSCGTTWCVVCGIKPTRRTWTTSTRPRSTSCLWKNASAGGVHWTHKIITFQIAQSQRSDTKARGFWQMFVDENNVNECGWNTTVPPFISVSPVTLQGTAEVARQRVANSRNTWNTSPRVPCVAAVSQHIESCIYLKIYVCILYAQSWKPVRTPASWLSLSNVVAVYFENWCIVFVCSKFFCNRLAHKWFFYFRTCDLWFALRDIYDFRTNNVWQTVWFRKTENNTMHDRTHMASLQPNTSRTTGSTCFPAGLATCGRTWRHWPHSS